MAAVEARFQLRKTLREILTRAIPYCEGLRHTREISEVSVVRSERIESHSAAILFASTWRSEKQPGKENQTLSSSPFLESSESFGAHFG